MKIARITTQQKTTNRYNVYIFVNGGEEYAFSVDENVLVNWQLKKGMLLSEEEVEIILQQDEERKAWNHLLHYITHSMRTQYQVEQHLKLKGYESAIIDEVIEKAKGYQYINDQVYATAFVRTQMNTTDKGPEAIKEQMKTKGISMQYQTEAIAQFTEEKQIENAITFLEKKVKQKRNESAKAMKNKIVQSLIRKGYSTDIAIKAWELADVKISETDERYAVFEQGEKVMKKWSKKYSGTDLDRKVKESLYRKGFQLSMIEEFLREQEMEDDGETI